ncbi:hypothetical protein GUA87_15400 [Sneathiella sp. P13V-1]|uniref:hypothetical protein n=1 Tax=Sneathiella sp. P13V-1 TaxID=2697366 RepID=UPI00187BBF3F|nr:hypothetical protein [Sneathiella sp. P13V-1]MBE7638244.1 hypothetical protein [Sneathiella sp. P13V-1]
MKINSSAITQAIYFTKKPPEFFIPAMTGGSATESERQAAELFFQTYNKGFTGIGYAKDAEVIEAVQKHNGFGPIMVTRKIDSLLLLPIDVN